MQAEVLVHRPVLAEESPRLLVTDPNGVYVDGTFGRGGHSRLILEKLSPQGRLIAFDRDEEAVKAAAQIQDPRFQIIHAPFASMKEELAKIGIDKVTGIFLDIGVSSPQIDDPERGFSFRFDGPLDMRMDTSAGETAAEWIARADAAEMAKVFKDLGEERFAMKAVISFHSLEDRIVKKFFEAAANPASCIDPRLPLLPSQLPQPLFNRAVRILPSEKECEENPRARSSVLRGASRTDAPWPEQGVQV